MMETLTSFAHPITHRVGANSNTGGQVNDDRASKRTLRCGKENARGQSNCADCNSFLRSKIDYGSLTDALVWGYLFEEISIPLVCNNAEVSFVDVITHLPSVRK
jgi:hypothetical protein